MSLEDKLTKQKKHNKSVAISAAIGLTVLIGLFIFNIWWVNSPVDVNADELHSRITSSATREFEGMLPAYPDTTTVSCPEQMNPSLYDNGDAYTIVPQHDENWEAYSELTLAEINEVSSVKISEGDIFYCVYKSENASGGIEYKPVTVSVSDTSKSAIRRFSSNRGASFTLYPEEGWVRPYSAR